MLSETIKYSDINIEQFYVSVYPEFKGLNAKRFSYNLKKENENIVFQIKADDKIALKAAKSSIEKLYKVFKKMQGLKNDKRSYTTKNSRASAA